METFNPGYMKIRHILAPVDFSEHSRAVVKEAVGLAEMFHASLTLYHVHEPVRMRVPESDPSIDNLEIANLNHAELQLRELAASARSEVTVDFRMESGVPWECIVNRAKLDNAGLIVMGTHGRSGLKRMFIGSVAERVVQHAPCSVMVVRPVPVAPKPPVRRHRPAAARSRKTVSPAPPMEPREEETEVIL
jgi:universal stress protein A